MAQLNVPGWFGPAPLARAFDGVVVGLRPPPSPKDMATSRPGKNGWRYSSQGSTILVEAVTYQVAATHVVAWTDLSRRLIEPNVFLDPCFVLPAVQHFAMARRPAFVLVWDESLGERHKLIGLCPVMFPRPRFGGPMATAWLHDQASVGVPLIDKVQAVETLDLLLDWLGREQPHVTGLMIPKLRQDGPMIPPVQLVHTTEERHEALHPSHRARRHDRRVARLRPPLQQCRGEPGANRQDLLLCAQ